MGSLSNGARFKSKRRKVSCVRDFPPGCGRNAPRINLKHMVFHGDKVNSMADKIEENLAKEDTVEDFENGNSLSQQMVKDTARDFSPECGQNAPHINLEDGNSEAEASLGNNEDSMSGDSEVVASVGYNKNSMANKKKMNAEKGVCVKAFENGNESVSQPGLRNALELELPAAFDDLVGRAVTALGVNAELSPTTGTMENGPPKASEMKESKLPKELHDTDALAESDGGTESKTLLEIGSASDGMVPASGSKACSLSQWHISDCNMLSVSALKRKLPRRKVSLVRNFPPFCGRNAPFPTEDERQKILLGNNTPCPSDTAAAGEMELLSEAVKAKVKGSPVSEATRTGVEELDADVGDRMKGILAELKSKAGKADVEGNPSIEKSKADVEVSPVRKRDVGIVKDDDDDVIDEDAKKRKLEGGIPKRKTKSQNVIGKDYEDVSAAKDEEGKETVVSPLHKSFMRETPSVAAVALTDPDRVIVQGMMAAPNCPWRQGKRSADRNSDPVVTVSKEGRHDISSFTTQEKPKSAPKLKATKNLLPSHKEAYKGKAKPVVKDDGDSAVQVRDEDTSGSKSAHDFEVTLPPFGPNSSSHGDERNKVRETLRLFQAICRKLLQAEEAKSRQKGDPAKRIDTQAAQIVRDKGKEVNTANFIIGSVPGVEVGDEFQYRVELALVGIHRLYQAGIDYRKHGGMMIATSIVASGVYADDLDNPDVLTYSGQGGNAKDKQPEDQKLERGNLALKNSITTKNPVRVVRGFKETKASKTDAKAKVVPSYIYDGLYTVERYRHDVGQHGKLVFMFELRRIPGQPGFAWKEVKKSNKFKTREGRCVDDISGGKELFPICAVNTMDSELPPIFNYINEMKYPDWHNSTPPKGCDCIGGCSDSKKCSCVVKNGGEIPYNYNGAIVEAKPIVYECGPSCTCRPSCYNRVTQHGIQIQLEIFKTESRGWGVRSLTSIPSGSFICEYFGELIEDKEAEERHNDEYLFDIGKNYSDCSPADGPSPELVEESCFTIDAAQFGSVGRFINHSCSPNLYAQNVLFDHEDKKMPHIMLFAAENIPPLQELTYHYNYSVDQVRDSSGNIKIKNCYCGSAECSGRMY